MEDHGEKVFNDGTNRDVVVCMRGFFHNVQQRMRNEMGMSAYDVIHVLEKQIAFVDIVVRAQMVQLGVRFRQITR